MKTLHRLAAVLMAACALLMSFTRTAAAEVSTRAGFVVGHCYATVNYGFASACDAVNRLLMWGGMSALHLHLGAVGDLSKVTGETIRVRMLKTVSNAHTTWFEANEEEGRDGLYDLDAETARAWLRDGVAEAVGTAAKAEAKDAAEDSAAPRASEVDPAQLREAVPAGEGGTASKASAAAPAGKKK
jgi:hypothetical protein